MVEVKLQKFVEDKTSSMIVLRDPCNIIFYENEIDAMFDFSCEVKNTILM